MKQVLGFMDADSEDPDNTDCEFPKEFGFDPNYELKLTQAWIETDIVRSMNLTRQIYIQ